MSDSDYLKAIEEKIAQHRKDKEARDFLAARHIKQDRRRFSPTPEPITGFATLEN